MSDLAKLIVNDNVAALIAPGINVEIYWATSANTATFRGGKFAIIGVG